MRRLTSFTLVLAAVLLAACSSGSGSVETSEPEPEPEAAVSAEAAAPSAVDVSDPGSAVADLEEADDSRPEDAAESEDDASGASVSSAPPKRAAASRASGENELVTASVLRTVSESYRFRWLMEIGASPELPSGIALGGDGAVDPSNEALAMSMDFSPIIDVIAAEFGGDDAQELGEIFALFRDPLELVVVGDAVYMSWGLFGDVFGVDTPWVSFSGTALGSEALGSVTGFDQASSPDQFLQLLRGIGDLSAGETVEIDGVATTRYSGIVDFIEAIENYALDEGEYGSLLSLAGDSIDPLRAVPVTIWVDEQERMRRFDMVIDLSGVEGGEMVSSVRFRYDLFDFGADTRITAPPAELVTDVTALFGGLFDSVLTATDGDLFVETDLTALRDECATGVYDSCDRLYWESPFDSDDEAFGETCGNRVEPGEVFSCAELEAA